ncbi:MAG TPA: hypothetical protein ENK02_09525, partial [Planctomycetes bacterium]|nr:hypothetical protein [Planctomycetota bacterium]
MGNATDVDAGRLSVRLEGYLGGWKTNGYALFRATFSDANKRKLASWEIGSDTHQSKRNYITKLLLRRKVFPVPPSSRTMVIEAVCQASDRFMDNLSCKLLLDWKLSSLPLGSNLIVNGSFETKELTGQPWEGWELFGVTDVGLYGTPKYPGLNYLFAMRKAKKDPGNYLCRTGNWVSQTFDLRGNSTQVDSGQYEFILKARTLSTNNTSGEFVVEFFNSLGAKIQSKSFRTWEYWRTSLRPILLPWSRRILIPPFSRKVVLTFKDRGAFQWLDEVSLFLGKTVNPPATPLGVNLIRGSDFEASDWLDFTSDTMEGAWVSGGSPPYLNPILGKYGTSPFPSLAHAKNILGGRQLLRTNGGNPGRPITGSGIESDFYLNGRNLLIDNGLLRIHFEGYFGGFGSQYASNSLRVTFFDQFQRKLGSVTTAPVTNKERGNKTVLLFRSKDVAVPIGTRRVLVQWEIRTATSYPLALADNLKVLFFDSRKGKFNYPGSGKDLTLFTGVDRLPTGGVGFDVKKAQGGKVLNVRIKSVKGTYNKEVILLLGQLFPTSKPPKPLFPPLAVGAGFGFILNGYANGGPLGPIRLLPNGSD